MMKLSTILFCLAMVLFLTGTHALCYLEGYKHGVEQATNGEDKR